MVEKAAQLSPRTVPEVILPKSIGEKVALSDGTLYRITGAFGQRKLMHTGRVIKVTLGEDGQEEEETVVEGVWFSYYHDTNDQSLVIAQGGKRGIGHINTLRRQMVHIVDNYLGARIAIDPNLWLEQESGGRQLTFQGLATALEENTQRRRELDIPDEYLIPGEQQLTRRWIEKLVYINSTLPEIGINIGRFAEVQREVAEIANSLRPSTNRFKQKAAQYLTEGLDKSKDDQQPDDQQPNEDEKSRKNQLPEDKARTLRAVMKAQIELLKRSQDLVTKTAGIMGRLNDLDIVQLSWNGYIREFPTTLAHIADVMNEESSEVARRVTISSALSESTGIFWKLDQMTGEPYFTRAQDYKKDLSPIIQLWQGKDLSGIKNLVDELNKGIKEWAREVSQQQGAVILGRFAAA